MAGDLKFLLPVLGILLVWLPGAANAQILADPMRPPVEFMPPAAKGGQVTLPNAQVVILGHERRLVTLNGETLREGDRVGDARVESVSDSEVVLRVDSKTRERILLYPGIAKTPSAASVRPGPAAGRTEGKK